MKKYILFVFVPILAISCAKRNSGYTNAPGPSLWPLKAGNNWIYQDSVYTDSALTSAYLDTATITAQTRTDQYGTVYYGISEPNGWFETGSYIAVDPYNTTIYEVDSSSNSPYIFFEAAQYDGQFLGSGYDFSDINCTKQASQYGFATTTNINGFNCLKNIEYTVDCNNITKEAVVTYVCPGTGVVRMEDYMADSSRNNALLIDYSQTLRTTN